MRGPMRSLSAPQPKPAAPIARKLSVIALDTAVVDQPVASVIGRRNTARENMAPIAMQVMNAPSATMTQPYRGSFMKPWRQSCSSLFLLLRHHDHPGRCVLRKRGRVGL